MKIYLAGPDVFLPNARAVLETKKALVRLSGHEPLSPLDNEASDADAIYSAYLQSLQQCDAVLANITPFRGPSADVGTAFEIGYARALYKEVVTYTDHPEDYKKRVELDGLVVEDFGLADNLMIAARGSALRASVRCTLDAMEPFIRALMVLCHVQVPDGWVIP